MERVDGSIMPSYGDGAREDFLFTYSEEEKEQHEIDKVNASLILNPEFIPIYPKMLQLGYSLIETAVYGFIRFFLSNNSKFFCTDEQLARMLGCGEWSISKAIKRLKDDGLIVLSHRIRAGGGKTRFISLSNSGTVNPTFPRCENHSSEMGNSQGIENKIIENKKIYKGDSKIFETGTSDESETPSLEQDSKESVHVSAVDEFEEAFRDFENMRKSIKKPLTAKAKKRLITRLNKLTPRIDVQIAILNQSVDHCWQDVYELKDNSVLEPQTDDEWIRLFDKMWDEGRNKELLEKYGREKYEDVKSKWVLRCVSKK